MTMLECNATTPIMTYRWACTIPCLTRLPFLVRWNLTPYNKATLGVAVGGFRSSKVNHSLLVMLEIRALMKRTRSFNKFASLLGDVKADTINLNLISRNCFRRVRSRNPIRPAGL